MTAKSTFSAVALVCFGIGLGAGWLLRGERQPPIVQIVRTTNQAASPRVFSPVPEAASLQDGTPRESGTDLAEKLRAEVAETRAPLRDMLKVRTMEKIRSVKGPEYDKLFAEFNVPDEKREDLKQKVFAIYSARLDASNALSNVTTLQGNFSSEMNSLLGRSMHDEFIAREVKVLAREELAAFQGFVAGRGQPADPAEADQIEELFYAAQAYSHGNKQKSMSVLAAVPSSTEGTAAMLQFPEIVANMKSALGRLDESAANSRLSPATVESVKEYFRSEIEKYEKNIERLRTFGPNPQYELPPRRQ